MNANYATLGPKLALQGFEPIPVAGKAPAVKHWQDVVLHRDQVAYWAENGQGHLNVGLRTTELAPIDVDIYDEGVSARVVAAARARFGDAPERVGMPPKALLLYAAVESGTKITSPIWVSPDGKEHRVEVLGIGQQFVAAGIHPDTHKPYTWKGDDIADLERWMLPTVHRDEVAAWINTELPALMPPDWVQKGSGSAGALVGEEDPFEVVKQRHDDVDLEGLRWMLDQLPQEYCDDRNMWRNVIFAAHHQFHGTEEEADALELVDEWSSKSVKYVTGVVAAIWENTREQRDAGLIAIGSLKSWVGLDTWAAYRAQRQAEQSVAVVEEQGWEARIAAADRLALEGQIIPEVRVAELSELTRLDLAGKIAARARVLNLSMTKGEAKKLIAPPRVAAEVAEREEAPDIDDWTSTAPSWAKEWAWIRGEGKFINRRNKRKITRESFDLEMQRHIVDLRIQEGDEWITYRASERMFQHWGAKAVDATAYHPAFGEFFPIEGETFINRYRPELRVEPAAAWTAEGRRMAAALDRHLALMLPNERERALFRAWLAHQYLHPGCKVRWAPLLKGCPGDGKSLFGELIERVLGTANVRLMNADTIQTSPFSGWVEGQCVTVFEEVKFHGHNRYDVVNRLKPYISNNRVEKHGKGLDPGSVWNVTNYLMLTNHEDAIPIEEGDRRYFVLFSPFNRLEEMDRALQADWGITCSDHFEEIFSTVRDNVGQLALWLSETRFPDDWNPNMSAPMTEAKKVMAASSKTEAEEAVAQILEDVAEGERIPGIGQSVVCVPYLKDAAMRQTGNRRMINDRTLAACLREAGYLPLPGGENGKARKVRWQTGQRSMWSKGGEMLSNDRVRQLLDETADVFPS